MRNAVSEKNVNYQYWSEHWDSDAILYLEKSSGIRYFLFLLKDLLTEVDKDSIKTILDIGCGSGNKTSILAEYFLDATVTGSDFSESAINLANAYYVGLKNLHFSTVNFLDENSSVGVEKYDLVSCQQVLEHIEQWQEFVLKISNITNKYLLLSFPTGRMRSHEKHLGHYRNFKRGEVERFMESNSFRTMRSINAGFPFFSPISRDIQCLFFNQYDVVSKQKMTMGMKIFHSIWYFLFRYCSLRSAGDCCICIFEKI